jgi:hypothetical protein
MRGDWEGVQALLSPDKTVMWVRWPRLRRRTGPRNKARIVEQREIPAEADVDKKTRLDFLAALTSASAGE